ncbi:MAG: esterase/lipase family protein [bacterium]
MNKNIEEDQHIIKLTEFLIAALILFLLISTIVDSSEGKSYPRHPPQLIPEDDLPLGQRTPLILIHGCGSEGWSPAEIKRRKADKQRWLPLLQFFKYDSEFNSTFKVYRFVYDSRMGIPENAHLLDQSIDNSELKGERLIILAHSMGGLIARYLISQREEDVLLLITLGTPHHGSPLANPSWVRYSLRRSPSIFSELLYNFAYEWDTIPPSPIGGRPGRGHLSPIGGRPGRGHLSPTGGR